jgi:hypothetical protein
MIRSAEFARSKGISPSGGVGKPELHHMRVTPTETGVQVTHHASPRAEAHETHSFTEHEPFMEHMESHVGEHLGLAASSGEPEAHSSKATGGLEAE